MRKVKKGKFELRTDNIAFYERIEKYSDENLYPETNIKWVSMKYLNASDDAQILVSYADFMNSGLITVDREDNLPPEKLIPQKHEGFELLFPVQGILYETIAGVTHEITARDAFLLTPDCESIFSASPGSILFVISITEDYFLRYYDQDRRFSAFPSVIRYFFLENLHLGKKHHHHDYLIFRGKNAFPESLQTVINTMFDELRGHSPGYDHLFFGLMIRMFHLLANPEHFAVETGDVQRVPSKELASGIKKYLDHEKRKISAEELAEVFHYHASYLSKVFRAQIGQSLKDYNEGVYLREVYLLLTETDLSIMDISERVGFSSRSQLYKAFQTYYQKSIQEVRQEGHS